MTYAFIFGFICLAAFACAIPLMVRTCANLLIGIRRGRNTDAAATQLFLELVGEMQVDMVIHDNGTDTLATLYNDRQILDALQRRLDGGAKVRCLFAEQADIGIAGLDKIEVHYLPADADWHSDLHFKIIDSGRKAYLSRHREDGEREYQIVDCSKTLKTGKRIFADLIEKFEQGVKVAGSSATA
jgi:hypothetical protein